MGGYIAGAQIDKPEDITKLEFDRVIISIPLYGDEIRKTLMGDYGIAEEKIVVYQEFTKDVIWEDERIIELRKCIQMMKERHIEGAMAEVGVYTAEFSKLFNRYFPERKLYLFDTFSGFDSSRDLVDESDTSRFQDTSVELVMGKMVNPENVIIRKGYFPDTVDGLEEKFALVSLDCDLYNPILAGLKYFYPRLVSGGYIFIHDFGSYHYTEVKTAVYEFCKETQMAIVPLTDRCQSVIISK